jgi:hypothetical protein
MTYRQITEKHNINYSTISRRVFLLKIKGLYVGREIRFTQEQVDEIVAYNPRAHFERRCKKNHPRKLRIIEFYLKRKSARKVAEFMNISRSIVDEAINEYKETGFIVVESKLSRIQIEEENINLV